MFAVFVIDRRLTQPLPREAASLREVHAPRSHDQVEQIAALVSRRSRVILPATAPLASDADFEAFAGFARQRANAIVLTIALARGEERVADR